MTEFLNLFDKSPIVVFEWKKIKSWSIVSVSPNVKKLVGYSSKEILNDNFSYLDLLTKEDQVSIQNQIVSNLKLKNNDFNIEVHKLRNKENKIIWVDTYINVRRDKENRVESFLGYIIDVSKHKKTEIELKEAKEKHQIISDSTIDGIFVLDKVGNMIFLNQGILTLTGRSMEELQDVHFSKYVPKSELPKYLLTLKSIFLKRKVENFVTKIIHKNGHHLDVEINGKLVKMNGKWVAQGSMRDISLRKKMSQNLKESEERFRIMFENNSTPTLFGDFSLLGEYFEEIKSKNKELSEFLLFKRIRNTNYLNMTKIIDLNKATLKLYETKNKKKLISNLHKSFPSLFFAELLQKLFYLWLKEEDFTINTSLETLKGSKRFVNIIYNKLPNIKGRIFQFVISVEDITDKKKIEKAFIRNQKLNTLGEIASSVAHDFNNSLQAILGNLELAMFDKSIKQETLKYLDVMKTLVVDASNRVSVLQRFGGKKEVIIYKYVNIKKLITDVVEQFAPIWKVNSEKLGIRIDIDVNCNSNLIVLANEGELHTVIHNLLKNSIEAMPKGGKVSFDVEEKGKNIEIIIKDNGNGMDKDTQSKVFQAFYTTKGFELGRGLGMSGVYRIIKDHKGDISVLKSSPKKGTSIKIVLPACNEGVNTEVVTTFEEKKESKLLKENLEILWVDDEEIIRKVMNQYLGILGYKCDIAESGMQALELMKKKDYNLVITDIGMPNMNGWQLIDKIRTKHSKDIKVVVVTGWILEIKKEEQARYNIYDVLEKPIQFKDLEKIFDSLSIRK